MKIQVMTEQEAKAAASLPPLPDGDYDCEVFTAAETSSKSSGMSMFDIELKVFDGEGKTRTIRDYVMTEGKAAWRLRQCWTAFGEIDRYEGGDVVGGDIEGRAGRVTLCTETDPTGQYAPKNRVKAYLAPTSHVSAPRRAAPVRQAAPADGFDDEIPF